MDKDLSLVEHLSELRKRIIVSLLALALGVAISFPFSSYGLKLLRLPAVDLIPKLMFFSPQEGFLVHMRIAFLGGLFLALPLILYQIWAFVSPAINERVKKYGAFFVIFCSISFMLGCLFAYFILIPPALRFLLSYAGDDMEPAISASRYISFVVNVIVGCGIVFEMPSLSMILTKIGVLNHRILRKKYKYALVTIVVVAAVITPTPDAFNMFLMALPMVLLYEISIWSSFFTRHRPR